MNVGIIGAGDVVCKSHLPTLLAMDDISVAWVTDRDCKRAKQVARSYRVNWLPVPEQLELLPYTDIVLLAIPYGARGPYYEVLRRRNSALYVEKPVSRSVDELRRFCSLFPPSRLAIGLQRRAWGPVVLLRKLIGESAYGKLNRVELRYGGSAIVTSGKSFVSDSKLAGGGVLFEHGIHGLDIALYITGAASAHSYRVNTIIEKGFDVHTEGEVMLINAEGEFALDFQVSWLAETNEGLTFIFDNAVIEMSVTEPRIFLKSPDGRVIASLTDESTIYPATGFQTLSDYWRSFLDGVKSGEANYTSAASSALVTELIEKIYSEGAKQ